MSGLLDGVIQRVKFAPLNLRDSILYSISTAKRAMAVGAIASATLVFMIYGIFPGYSYQMLTSGVSYWPQAFVALFELLYVDEGLVGVLITVLYAAIIGITIVVIYGRTSRIATDSIDGWLSLLAAFTVGCVSCGAGLLGLIGGVSGIALVSFSGVLFRIAGIGLALMFLSREGNPTTCRIA